MGVQYASTWLTLRYTRTATKTFYCCQIARFVLDCHTRLLMSVWNPLIACASQCTLEGSASIFKSARSFLTWQPRLWQLFGIPYVVCSYWLKDLERTTPACFLMGPTVNPSFPEDCGHKIPPTTTMRSALRRRDLLPITPVV